MKVDAQQLVDDGYIILREVVPSDELQHLRETFETLVDRQKEVWRAQRKPDDPPGGAFDTSKQPRVFFNEVVDGETSDAAGFCLHENTLGVSRQLVNGPDAAVSLMALMCSPTRDHGPAHWHRDVNPPALAPLRGLQTDLLEGGVSYVQWNIPLYDDSVLWVVPGSHIRPNTDEEHNHLLTGQHTPIPGGIPVELNAGDGVVYSNLILHWGSNYSPKVRRTIHISYRSFDGRTLPYVGHNYYRADLARLPGDIGRGFEQFVELENRRYDQIEVFFRAIIDKDPDRFLDALAILHPVETARMVAVVLTCRMADKIQKLKRPDIVNLPFDERVAAVLEHRLSFQPYETFADRFTKSDADALWSRFESLAARLQADAERVVDNDIPPSRYLYTEMPEHFEAEDFIASWN